MLATIDLTVERGNRRIINTFTHTWKPGQLHALTGPSGIGKTTLGLALAGQIPHSGIITVGGHTPTRTDVFYLAQDPTSALNPAWTIARSIAEPARIRRTQPQVTTWLSAVGLDSDTAARKPHQLSGGQRQRACLARGLATGARWLIADEPTAHLDPIAARNVTDSLLTVCSRGLGIILITHNPHIAATAHTTCDLHEHGLHTTVQH